MASERRFQGVEPEHIVLNLAMVARNVADCQRAIMLGHEPSVVRSISKRTIESANLVHAQIKDVYRGD